MSSDESKTSKTSRKHVRVKKSSTLKKHILEKTYFIPSKHMHTLIENLNENGFIKKKKVCDNNLFLLQRTRLNTFDFSLFSRVNWTVMFTLACHKALYAHNWDKLLFMLQKVPRWKFSEKIRARSFLDAVYTRFLTLLLMYHPSSQAQGLLCEYLHMTWGCRTDEDKKAILKVLLHLPSRLPQPYNSRNLNGDDSD